MVVFSFPLCLSVKLSLSRGISYNNITVIVAFSQESEFPFSTVTDSKYNRLVWEHNITNEMLFSEYTGKRHSLLLLGNSESERFVTYVRKALLRFKCLRTAFGFNEKNDLFHLFFAIINSLEWAYLF